MSATIHYLRPFQREDLAEPAEAERAAPLAGFGLRSRLFRLAFRRGPLRLGWLGQVFVLEGTQIMDRRGHSLPCGLAAGVSGRSRYEP